MQDIQFLRLNGSWNADPNAPSVHVQFEGGAAKLRFTLNSWQNNAANGETATIRFTNCSRWNWDATDDHAWFAGEGRYARQAPKWGEFHEVVGDEILGNMVDWEVISADSANARHFLFCFRDETLDFIATDWSIVRHRGLPFSRQ